LVAILGEGDEDGFAGILGKLPDAIDGVCKSRGALTGLSKGKHRLPLGAPSQLAGWHQAANRVAIAESGGKMRGIVAKRYSTSTLIDSASCVPWLAAEGPLAYTPENPPDTDARRNENRQQSWQSVMKMAVIIARQRRSRTCRTSPADERS
jgi:hypothetical protein